MANCVCCGRKIKFSEMSYTLDSLYWGEACPECHKKWLDHRYLAAAKILEKSPREVRLILEENGFSVLEANQVKFEEVLDGFKDIAPKIMISEEAKLEKENADAEKRKIIEDNKRQEQERLEEYKKALPLERAAAEI